MATISPCCAKSAPRVDLLGKVTAAAADPVVAERLNVAIGAPLLKVVRLHFDAIGRPIQHFELLAPPVPYQLRMSLRGNELER